MRLVPAYPSAGTRDSGIQIPDAYTDKHRFRSEYDQGLVDRVELMYGYTSRVEYRPPFRFRFLKERRKV